MTNDFDDLASAYIDGQLTEIEVARVENDPELLAQVAELRSIAEALDIDVSPSDDTQKRRQLGAALEAFDQLGVGGAASSSARRNQGSKATDLVDLGQRRAQTDSPREEVARPGGRAGLPNWLGVAAALLLVVGGIGFLSQVGGGDDDVAVDASSANESISAGESSGDAADFDQTEDDEEATEDAMEDEGAESPAAEAALVDQAADGAGSEADESSENLADDSAEESATPTTVRARSTTAVTSTSGGLFPSETVDEARVFFGEVPDADAVSILAQGQVLAPSLSQCAIDGALADGRAVVGFVPIGVDQPNGDVLFGEVVFVELEPESVSVLLTETCTPLE